MLAAKSGFRYTTMIAAAVGVIALLMAGTFAPRTTAAPTCHLAGTWNQSTPEVASTSWTIQADGTAEENGSPGARATGKATLSGGDLTINWSTPTHYAGTYRWTLQSNCSGTGELTFTEVAQGDDRKGKTYKSTVTGPAPTEEPTSGCGRRVAHAAAVNEVRVVAVQPDVQVHKAGTPEDAWCTVHKDTVLQQGDEISCDPDGAATLQFADNSTVVIRHTTQLKIASFFTEGGVVKTEILLRMGEVAAQVHKSEATKSDQRIKSPTSTASVRGTDYSVFYDPGARSTITTVREGVVEVDPVKPGLPTVQVPAGKEVEVGASSMSKVVPTGKAGARGGLNRRDALAKVLKIVARGNGPCHVTMPRANAFALKPASGGWSIKVKLQGGLKGTSSWRVKAKRAKPVNALAKKIARRCK